MKKRERERLALAQKVKTAERNLRQNSQTKSDDIEYFVYLFFGISALLFVV